MKKNTAIALSMVLGILTIDSANALGGDDRGHKHSGHGRHLGEHYYSSAGHYGSRPTPNYQDPRSHQGLAGGVVGSVIGYELGNGNPVVTGIGAAAGSLIGNKVSGKQ